MYMNAFQKRIALLIDEYGCLSKKQLCVMVNAALGSALPNLNGYISQMCRYGDYEEIPYSSGNAVIRKGSEPNFDIVRSAEIMICFFPEVLSHHKARSPVAIRFYKNSEQSMKEISVIPVRAGEEKMVSAFAEDKFSGEKSEIVIFLLETKEQMKLIKANGKFAVIEKQGVRFFKK